MYFEGVGTLPFEPPHPELKPFFRRKGATVFKGYNMRGDSLLRRNDFIGWIDKQSNPITDVDEKRKFVTKHMKSLDEFIMFGTQTINERDFINAFVNLAFSDTQTRKLKMTAFREATKDYFVMGDVNNDGFMTFNEFRGMSERLEIPLYTTEKIFETSDPNKDGLMSQDEYSYCITSFFFNSGPDDPISLYFGELVKNR